MEMTPRRKRQLLWIRITGFLCKGQIKIMRKVIGESSDMLTSDTTAHLELCIEALTDLQDRVEERFRNGEKEL